LELFGFSFARPAAGFQAVMLCRPVLRTNLWFDTFLVLRLLQLCRTDQAALKERTTFHGPALRQTSPSSTFATGG
jgi:hypothetical protein